MKEIVVATRNKKKLSELKRLLKGVGVKPLSLERFKDLPVVKEDGATFRANARKKALAVSCRIDRLVMSDDSGLEVPALGYAPGIHSARYAGLTQNDERNNTKLLAKMRGLHGRGRRAHFCCVICLSKGRRIVRLIEGKVEGTIATKARGSFGFGYDPIFTPKGYNKTFAQLGAKVKDRISHRAIALREARDIIREYFRRYP